MFFDFCDVRLEHYIEPNALSAQNELVQILPVLGFDVDPGTDILSDKRIIEDDEFRKGRRPCAVLKDERCGGGRLDDDLWRLLRGEPTAFENGGRVAVAE
jgi:hypothetical protein